MKIFKSKYGDLILKKEVKRVVDELTDGRRVTYYTFDGEQLREYIRKELKKRLEI